MNKETFNVGPLNRRIKAVSKELAADFDKYVAMGIQNLSTELIAFGEFETDYACELGFEGRNGLYLNFSVHEETGETHDSLFQAVQRMRPRLTIQLYQLLIGIMGVEDHTFTFAPQLNYTLKVFEDEHVSIEVRIEEPRSETGDIWDEINGMDLTPRKAYYEVLRRLTEGFGDDYFDFLALGQALNDLAIDHMDLVREGLAEDIKAGKHG